jgi:hypothetical protein
MTVPLLLASAAVLAGDGRDAISLMRRVNDLMRGQTSYGRMTMTIVTPDWTRTLEARLFTKGRTTGFVRILEPAKDRGAGTLRIGSQMWNWLPRVERVVKVPPSMMLMGWMGSDVTNHDVVKSDSLIVDYEHRLLASRVEGGATVWTIEGVPKPDAPVVWGRVVVTAREEGADLYPTLEEDFNERGELVRRIVFSEPERVAGLLRPMRMEVVPLKRPGRKTVVRHSDLVFDVEYPDEFFSLRTLERGLEDTLWTPPGR